MLILVGFWIMGMPYDEVGWVIEWRVRPIIRVCGGEELEMDATRRERCGEGDVRGRER